MIRVLARIAAAAVGLLILGAAAPTPPTARPIAAGIWLIPGGILDNREPDGNTVIFRAPEGLIVMDTGRHLWHRQAILDFARDQHQPIVAIVNSHWHLDHVSGNADLKRAYPQAKIYASNAINDALTGFLPKSAADAQAYLDSGQAPPEMAQDIRADMATTASGAALKPDLVVNASGMVRIGGLTLSVNLAPNAATDGDVWVYDPETHTAAVGDLVTLPAPFLDTACSKGWRTALDAIAATPFTRVIPGHGSPMTRGQFETYRKAFGALIDCAAASGTSNVECAANWASDTTELRDPGETEGKRAFAMAQYYVRDVLRAHGGDSAYCKVKTHT
jgi:glyoxylase-like metal-dependent hydrolase (beta-lactamase superfamily II)